LRCCSTALVLQPETTGPFTGDAEARDRFTIMQERNRVLMRIGALDEEGLIFVNGKQVHQRRHFDPMDWTRSFAFDVTDALRPGQANTVAILLMNREGAAGLWRGVGLYETEEK
jgi:hypothetical protein